MVNDSISPLEVIAALNEAGVRFLLVGAYGLVGWTKSSRATEDVDVIVPAKQHKKAVRTLLVAFPHLDLDDNPAVARLRDRETKEAIIDVIKPYQQLFQTALKNTHSVQSGEQSYNIPSLEMALTMKFAAMISPSRSDEKKHIDAHDFIRMIKVNTEISLEKVSELGEFVYPGGGKELLEKIAQVRQGQTLQI